VPLEVSGVEACKTPYTNTLIHEMNDDSIIARATCMYRVRDPHKEIVFAEILGLRRQYNCMNLRIQFVHYLCHHSGCEDRIDNQIAQCPRAKCYTPHGANTDDFTPIYFAMGI
jgi:hypothetical protein